MKDGSELLDPAVDDAVRVLVVLWKLLEVALDRLELPRQVDERVPSRWIREARAGPQMHVVVPMVLVVVVPIFAPSPTTLVRRRRTPVQLPVVRERRRVVVRAGDAARAGGPGLAARGVAGGRRGRVVHGRAAVRARLRVKGGRRGERGVLGDIDVHEGMLLLLLLRYCWDRRARGCRGRGGKPVVAAGARIVVIVVRLMDVSSGLRLHRYLVCAWALWAALRCISFLGACMPLIARVPFVVIRVRPSGMRFT